MCDMQTIDKYSKCFLFYDRWNHPVVSIHLCTPDYLYLIILL